MTTFKFIRRRTYSLELMDHAGVRWRLQCMSGWFLQRGTDIDMDGRHMWVTIDDPDTVAAALAAVPEDDKRWLFTKAILAN